MLQSIMRQWIAIVVILGHQFRTFTSGGSDFLRDIGIPKGPHYHQRTEWSI